jgi:hypothetical protein
VASATPTIEQLAFRLEWLEKERVRRVETDKVDRSSLDRETDARKADDRALGVAIQDMKEDIQTIKNNTTWALRTVAGTMFIAIASFIVTVATRGGG